MNDEEKRKYEAFQYWIQTNTKRGVTAIPDNLCLFVINLIEKLQKEKEELKKDYYNVINKIENKIDRFDYIFEKAKRQNNKDKADCYWNLIINFKELLESEK